MAILDILFRWLHVVAAALMIGGAVFLRIILPAGTSNLDDEQREALFLRCRRAFKMVIHPAILAILVSGAYNTWFTRNWETYAKDRPVMHGLWGSHLFLGLAIIGLSLWLLAGREPPRGHRPWSKVNMTLLFLTVAVASTLKYVRDYRVRALADIADVADKATVHPGAAQPVIGPDTRPDTAPAAGPAASAPAE